MTNCVPSGGFIGGLIFAAFLFFMLGGVFVTYLFARRDRDL